MTLKIPERPLEILPARIWRTYTGGKLIDEFHGLPERIDGNKPEEWILSTVEARNTADQSGQGISRIVVNEETLCLQDFIECDPVATLGRNHTKKYGKQLAILVGLIDSAERLTVQVHPNSEDAKKYFGTPFGKTEGWYIMGLREGMNEPNHIYIGFRDGVSIEEWKQCFNAQDYKKMLSMLHKIPVKVGEAYIVNSGEPHAVGEGCFILELQEPNDYTLRVEKVTPGGFSIDDTLCHQGIGFDNMFKCFNYHGVSEEEVLKKYRTKVLEIEASHEYSIRRLIGPANTNCFCLDEIVVNEIMIFRQHESYYGLFVIDGNGKIVTDDMTISIGKGQVFFVPAVCPGFELISSSERPLKVMRFFVPLK